MCRPDLTVLPLPDAVTLLARWITPHIPAKLLHPHEEICDADLLAVTLLQKLHKMPYLSRWWRLLKVNHSPHWPSEPHARIRLARLTPMVEQFANKVQELDFVVVDSESLPVSTFKRAPRCKFRGAHHGFSTAGLVYGFKLHAWSALNGKIVKYAIRPANEHDFSVLCEMNRDGPAISGPKQIGGKGDQSGKCLTSSKINTKRVILAGSQNTKQPESALSWHFPSWWVRDCPGDR